MLSRLPHWVRAAVVRENASQILQFARSRTRNNSNNKNKPKKKKKKKQKPNYNAE